MKKLNTIQFIANAAEVVTSWKAKITGAETYEDAKKAANYLLGYIDCMVTFGNTMICTENNDFTADFGDVTDRWKADVYQAMATKADETHQDGDTIIRLLQRQDEYLPQ